MLNFIAGFISGIVFVGLLLYLVPGNGKVEDDTLDGRQK